MKIITSTKIDNSKYGHFTFCDVYCIHVEIDETVPECAKEMTEIVLDTSWITQLNPLRKKSYEPAAQITIKKLVEDVFNWVENSVSINFWEYLISFSAQKALEKTHKHKKVPLPELFKEKLSGNPWFDFHTETHVQNIAFGESKYNSSKTPRKDTLEQVIRFIDQKKDDMDLLHLESFVTWIALQNAQENRKSYVAAFSLNAKNPNTIFENALKSKEIKSLIENTEIYLQELYLVAIDVCKSKKL